VGDLAGRGPLGLKGDRAKADPGHMARVAGLPCAVCGSSPVSVHHVICGRYGQRRAPDAKTIPLCWNHHQGPDGIHTRKEWWVQTFGNDTDYLPWVEAQLGVVSRS
jgi:hypothetical protein